MKVKAISAGVAIVGLIGGLLYLLPVLVLTVRLPREDFRLVGAVRITKGDLIELRYLHSVERTRVVGRFSVGDGYNLLAVETRMMSVGSGMPNTDPERTRREGGWMVVDEKKRVLPDIRFYYVSLNDTHLKVAGQSLAIDTIRSGSLLLIRVENPRLVQWGHWLVTGRMWPKL